MGGAELHGLLPLVLDRVDGEDVLGAGQPGALDRVGADAADADHDDGVAGLHVGRVDGGAPSGDHAAAEQAGLVERDVLVDLDAAGLVDDRVVGERAEQAHQAEVLALGVVARRAVGDLQPGPSVAPRSQRFWWPVEQLGQRPHDGMNPNTT